MSEHTYIGAEHTYIVGTITTKPVIEAKYDLPLGLREELLQLPTSLEQYPYRYSVFLRTYSRLQANGKREQWIDTVLRVIQGTMECYIDHMQKHGLRVDYDEVNSRARTMARLLYQMKWSPPGRGLYSMGTDVVRRNGNSSLNNCYACSTKDLVKALSWAFDQLMLGGGVGFDCSWNNSTESQLTRPNKEDSFVYVIPDSRQGWCSAFELLLRAYVPVNGQITNKFPRFDYSEVRPYGAPIRGFGGTASGPEPLRILLVRTEIFLDTFLDYLEATDKEQQADVYERLVRRQHEADAYDFVKYDIEEVVAKVRKTVYDYHKPYSASRLVVDLFNSVGSCVVSGNVRRSSLIALADAGDKVFLDLKNLSINPERRSICYRSNNTVRFWRNDDFETYLPEIAERIKNNGEPGFFNLINAQKYSRYTDIRYGHDKGTLLNPCGEIVLESYEPCTLSTICPYNCREDVDDPKSPINEEDMLLACEAATFYATVVTTVRHHWPDSNEVIARNRRIGVSFTGIANIYDNYGATQLITTQRRLYYRIREVNEMLASRFGIPRSIRVTTIKPEGTLSIVMGVAPGVHFPIVKFGKRRVGFDAGDPLIRILADAGYETEQSVYNKTMVNVIFPITSSGARAAKKVSIYEKFQLAALAQRYFSDNSVSFTGDFSFERESDDVERVLAAFGQQMKSCSMLPYFEETTPYAQMPFEEVSEDEYHEIKSRTREVDWSPFFESKTVKDVSRDEVSYCTGDTCDISARLASSSS
jgi:ribonucleoside-diphosphate reductase alpha chain